MQISWRGGGLGGGAAPPPKQTDGKAKQKVKGEQLPKQKSNKSKEQKDKNTKSRKAAEAEKQQMQKSNKSSRSRKATKAKKQQKQKCSKSRIQKKIMKTYPEKTAPPFKSFNTFNSCLKCPDLTLMVAKCAHSHASISHSALGAHVSLGWLRAWAQRPVDQHPMGLLRT